MIWRIDVIGKKEESSESLAAEVRDVGVLDSCRVIRRNIFFIEAQCARETIALIAGRLLIDPVCEDYQIHQGIFDATPCADEIIITHNPGVCDPVTISMEKAISDLGMSIKAARTGRFYRLQGLSNQQIISIAPKIFFNPLIEHILEYEKVKHLVSLDEFSGKDYVFKLISVSLLSAGAKELAKISHEGCLSLCLDEMRIIQEYFRNLKRDPTDCELETIATLWSEHCGHKTFRGIINYEDKDGVHGRRKKTVINNLLKTTVMKATKEIKHPSCVSVFHDNSGIVRFDDDYNICFKVETHNHPSSLEPYGGASTGIGGVIRDILGTGCAARPFASIDVFCFAPWQIKHKDLPIGLLHPKRIMRGVIKGVRDYGNRMGIPTVAGAVIFDERFLGNPLVFCGTLGILPRSKSFKKSKPGDLVILCGARTGRDGIHGATFSSKELDDETLGLTSAVQIGNAIEEKKLTEAILRARDKNLFSAITDCGAGGISSAVTELAAEHGVEVNLERVSLKYRGLSYTDIWISESQERMVFFTQQEHLAELEEIFKEEDVELSVIGKVTDTKKLVLFYNTHKVCELDMNFIFHLPKLAKRAVWNKRAERDVRRRVQKNYNDDVCAILARPNIACKDWVLREYDHEVQAGSVLKSIYGIERLSVSDAAILRPDLKSKKCVAVGLGINPFYSDIDPYHMASLSIEEALRNVVCVGADLRRTYILDNFGWGSPRDPKILGGLVRAAFACYDFSKYFKVPFVSGKDSLYNEYAVGKKHIAIPGTLLVSAMSVMDDYEGCASGVFKKEGNLVYLVGLTKRELGASEYFRHYGLRGGIVPKIDKRISRGILAATSNAVRQSLAVSCHDLSEGGLAVALAEMCIGSCLGAHIFLGEVPGQAGLRADEILFSESASRFVVEVEKCNQKAFERAYKSLPYGLIGCVRADKRLTISGTDAGEVVSLTIDQLQTSWTKTFQEFR